MKHPTELRADECTAMHLRSKQISAPRRTTFCAEYPQVVSTSKLPPTSSSVVRPYLDGLCATTEFVTFRGVRCLTERSMCHISDPLHESRRSCLVSRDRNGLGVQSDA